VIECIVGERLDERLKRSTRSEGDSATRLYRRASSR